MIKRHGKVVLEGEINRKILKQALSAKNLQVTQVDIDAEIAHAANLFGYVTADGKPDVDKWIKAALQESGQNVSPELYLRDAVWPSVALKKLTGGKVEVFDEDLLKVLNRTTVLAPTCWRLC